MKTILNTLVILLITAALGWGTYLLIQRSPQASAAGGFGGERPGISDGGTPRTRPEGFRGEEGEFEGRESFGAIGGIVSMVGHIILFAAVTFLFAVFGKLLPKKNKTVEADH